jgi:hypothetical protein
MATNPPQIARTAIDQMPPVCRFSADDGQVILAHREFLLGLEARLVTFFYDTLFEHPPTAAVFYEGERPDREQALAGWWRRTVAGPLDLPYFTWMAQVGLFHVVRAVRSPMMIGMSDALADFVAEQASGSALSQADAAALAKAFRRLAGTVSAVIAHGYDESVSSALSLARVHALVTPDSGAEPGNGQEPATAEER